MPDELLRSWPDGHQLKKDRYQWIVKHPATCRNARRGTSRVKQTYLTTEAALRWELGHCGVSLASPKAPAHANA